MARPLKQGIDYYPLGVDFLKDLKVRKVVKACGPVAPVILISLLSNIYREHGYYVVWDNDMPFLIADEVGVSEGAVDEIVKKSLQVGLFEQRLFEDYSILTSKGIQRRFLAATERRKCVTMFLEYCLIDNTNGVYANINLVNVYNNSKNAGGNPQSKVKKSKAKKSIKTSTGDADAPPQEKVFDKDDIPYKCSKFLADKILLSNPKARVPKDDAGLYKWCVHIDRLLRIDGKEPEELRNVLAFAVKDSFWSANILSTKNFREKYDQLYAKMKTQGGARPDGNYGGHTHSQMQEPELHDVIVGDFLAAAVQRYNVEVAASLELIRKYTDLRPYITEELDPQNKFDGAPILTLTVGRDSNYLQNVDLEKYLRTVRHKYWRALFHNEKFMGRLTSALREKYVKTVDRRVEAHYPVGNVSRFTMLAWFAPPLGVPLPTFTSKDIPMASKEQAGLIRMWVEGEGEDATAYFSLDRDNPAAENSDEEHEDE